VPYLVAIFQIHWAFNLLSVTSSEPLGLGCLAHVLVGQYYLIREESISWLELGFRRRTAKGGGSADFAVHRRRG
jgi:hypothetical protein